MTKDHTYFVYILASRKNGTLYAGVTNHLIRRVQEHRDGLVPGFTKKYAVKLLVYFEVHADINEAIAREKRIKRWLRAWKLKLIEQQNPQWRDLWPDLASNTPWGFWVPALRNRAHALSSAGMTSCEDAHALCGTLR